MSRLSEEAKKSLVEKALAQHGKKIAEIAKSHNVGYSSLQRWISRYKAGAGTNTVVSDKSSSKAPLTPSEQLHHLLATSNLDETALSAYCRAHGLYSFELQQWKNALMVSPDKKKKVDPTAELKALRAEIKLLKKDLRRKDRALAETAALLVLKKKVDLIWGEPEDD
jgi:transposase